MVRAEEWPLVGRGAELERIAQARREQACGVVVSAAAGVGKSRLAREALAIARMDGAFTESVLATRSAAAVPLGAFAGLFGDDERSGPAVSLMRDSARALRDRADGRPIVLGVDDAQRLDPVSAALVAHLALNAGVFVIATVRAGSEPADAIVALHKDAGAQQLELEPLDGAAMRTLIETGLDGPVHEAALLWVVERAGGNPMYARGLVDGALEAGHLRREHGLWVLDGAPSIPVSLMELVGERIDALPEAQREAVELLAVGEPLGLEELAELSSYDALSELERAGLITVGAGVRLAHPLYADALAARLPALRSRSLHLRLGRALAQRQPLSADDALRVVRLLQDARAEVPSPLLADAARAANAAGDPALGARLAEQAEPTVETVLTLARSYAILGRFEEAETRLAAIEPEMPGHPRAIPYLEQRVRVLFWGLGLQAETLALLGRARDWSQDQAWAPQLLAVRMPVAVAEDLPGTVAAMEAALADADAPTRRLLEPRQVLALFYAGRWDEAQTMAFGSRPAIPIRDYSGLVWLSGFRFAGIESGSDLDRVGAELNELLVEGVRARDWEAAAQAATGLAALDLLRGRFRDCARWLAEAVDNFGREDAFCSIADVHVLEVVLAHALGDLDAATAALGRLRGTLSASRPRPLSRDAYVQRAEGLVACLEHPVKGRAALLAAAAAQPEAMPGCGALLAYDALLAGAAPSEVDALLSTFAARSRARLIDAYAAHARALAAADGAALLAAAEEFAAIGASRYGARAAAHAARAFIDQGRQDSARRAAARAQALHEDGHGVPAPTIDGLDQVATELTAREQQLVQLARQGRTNAEIADRLVISVRTVETHIYRAMQKLGVSDRRDL